MEGLHRLSLRGRTRTRHSAALASVRRSSSWLGRRHCPPRRRGVRPPHVWATTRSRGLPQGGARGTAHPGDQQPSQRLATPGACASGEVLAAVLPARWGAPRDAPAGRRGGGWQAAWRALRGPPVRPRLLVAPRRTRRLGAPVGPPVVRPQGPVAVGAVEGQEGVEAGTPSNGTRASSGLRRGQQRLQHGPRLRGPVRRRVCARGGSQEALRKNG